MPKPILLIASLAAVSLLLGLAFWSWQQSGSPSPSPDTDRAATVLPQPRVLPDFHLTDHRQQAFGPTQLRDHWSVLFFGFTRCPDICPNTLALLRAVKARLARDIATDSLQIVFISVDPKYDDPASLRRYIEYFDEDFIAVTGTEAELQKLTEALYMPYTHVPIGQGGDYTVEHSGALVVINPQAQAAAYFSPPLQSDAIAKQLRELLKG